MKDLDAMKDKLQIDNIDLLDRKKLFNKFVEGGGEVITNKKSRPKRTVQKKTDRALVENDKSKGGSLLNRDNNEAVLKTKDNPVVIKTPTKKIQIPIGKKFDLWFNAWKNKVITLFGSKVSKKFYNYVNGNITNIMLESQNLLINSLYPPAMSSDVAKTNHETILKALTSDEDLELIQRYIDNYNEGSYIIFLRLYETNGKYLKASDYLDAIISIIKPLYITKNYSSRIKIAAEKSFLAYAKLYKIGNSSINKQISTFKKNVDTIYNVYYKKLFSLLEYASIDSLEKDIITLLNIGEEDVFGYYTIKRIREEDLKNKMVEEAKKNIGKENRNKHDKIVDIGLKLVNNIVDYKKIKSNISNFDDMCFLDERDKVFRIKVLFDLLDKEYSIVFLAKYVKYNMLFDDHQKIDYLGEFTNATISVSDLRNRLNEYIAVSKNISVIEKDMNITDIRKSKLLRDKNSQRSIASKKLRDSYYSIISSLKMSMDKLMLDKKERERVIANPDDVLKLDLIMTGENKKLSGYTVIQALTETFYYVSALHYLITQGELSGNGIFVDDDNNNDDEVDSISEVVVDTDDSKEEANDAAQLLVYDSTKNEDS